MVTTETYPIGNSVECDSCGALWTERRESGGMIFESKAICPDCTPRWLTGAKANGEEHFIRARCPRGVSFADFVRIYRGPDAAVTITTYDDAGDFFGS